MTVKFGNKEYQTVAERLLVFFDKYSGYTITTKVAHQDDNRIIMRAVIRDQDNRKVSTGTASRDRGSDSFTNKDTEKCETNAVGRALAFLSAELMGEEIASADEVSASSSEQTEKRLLAQWSAFTQKVEEHHDTLLAIREFLAENNFDAAREAWNEVSNDDKTILWRATTKGGWFTPRERNQMKWWSNDFENGRKG